MINSLSKHLNSVMRDQSVQIQKVSWLDQRRFPDLFLKAVGTQKVQLPTFELMLLDRAKLKDNKETASIPDHVVFHVKTMRAKSVFKSKTINHSRETFHQVLSLFGYQKYYYIFTLQLGSLLVNEDLLAKQTMLALQHLGGMNQNKSFLPVLKELEKDDVETVKEKKKKLNLRDILMNSFDDGLQTWLDYRNVLKNKGQQVMDPAVSMQIFAVHLYEKLEDKQKFYMEIVKIMEFLSRNYDIMEFYEKYLNDNKQFEVAVRRLFEMCQITDLYGKKMLTWAIKVYKPANIINILDTMKVVYEENYL